MSRVERSSKKSGATSTTNFGSGRRESHDATAFYERFTPPELSDDTTINRTAARDVIYAADARDMSGVPSNSVALVVTSPPYFAGKAYEEDLEAEGVPANYLEYLAMLRSVFTECKRVLEPGGRIAVNVANLGRRPYRSLAGDVTAILQDLGLLLRGEVVWWKGRAAGGSCAWGTFQRPSNPVLRDVTERVVIASKGRFERALDAKKRHELGLPSTATISRDEFMEATTDLWEIAPESATKVGHPAPFPVALPLRLIELFTYAGDVVLDPFMGSGSTAVASVRTGRHFIGFDTDPAYIALAEDRVASEQARLALQSESHDGAVNYRVSLPAILDAGWAQAPDDSSVDGSSVDRASVDGAVLAEVLAASVREGRQARDVARDLIETCGFGNIRNNVKPRGMGIVLSFVACDRHGNDWAFDVTGAFTTTLAGLRRADTLWKSISIAAIFHEAQANSATTPMPLVLLTTDVPVKSSANDKALRTMTGPGRPIADVMQILNVDDQARLANYADHGFAAISPT